MKRIKNILLLFIIFAISGCGKNNGDNQIINKGTEISTQSSKQTTELTTQEEEITYATTEEPTTTEEIVEEKYQRINSINGASFEVRAEDIANSCYNIALPPSHPRGNGKLLHSFVDIDESIIFSSHNDYSLVKEQEFVYECITDLDLSWNIYNIKTDEDFYDFMFGNNSSIGRFRKSYYKYNAFSIIHRSEILDIKLRQKNDYLQCEAEVNFYSKLEGSNLDGEEYHGYLIVAQKDLKNTVFFFGGKDGYFTREELEYIKDSFTLDDSEYYFEDDELELIDETFEGNKLYLSGKFPVLFKTYVTNRDKENYDSSPGEFIFTNPFINEEITLKMNYTENITFDDYIQNNFPYSSEKKFAKTLEQFNDKDGNKWNKVLYFYNDDEGVSHILSVNYVCIEGNCVYEFIYKNCELESDLDNNYYLNLLEEAISTISVAGDRGNKLEIIRED